MVLTIEQAEAGLRLAQSLAIDSETAENKAKEALRLASAAKGQADQAVETAAREMDRAMKCAQLCRWAERYPEHASVVLTRRPAALGEGDRKELASLGAFVDGGGVDWDLWDAALKAALAAVEARRDQLRAGLCVMPWEVAESGNLVRYMAINGAPTSERTTMVVLKRSSPNPHREVILWDGIPRPTSREVADVLYASGDQAAQNIADEMLRCRGVLIADAS